MHPAPRTMHLGQGQNTLVIAESARFQDRGECLEEVRGLTASSGSLKETQTHGDKRRTTVAVGNRVAPVPPLRSVRAR